MTNQAIEASERYYTKFRRLLYSDIEAVMASDRPNSDRNSLPYRADWTREDEAALLVRKAMGSDFNHQAAKAIVREWLA